MSAHLKPWTLDEFLDWERNQEFRWEFDGYQPVAMAGARIGHARMVGRLITALTSRLRPPCEAFTEMLKVRVPGDRIRYPDVLVACGELDEDDDTAIPTIVFEVLSPSTEPTDRRVKAIEYGGVAAIQAYAIVELERPVITLHRRSTDWAPETLEGRDVTLALPEIAVTIPLTELYPTA